MIKLTGGFMQKINFLIQKNYLFLFITLISVSVLYSQDPRKDAENLNLLHEKYRNSFEEIHGNNLFYGNTDAEAEEVFKKLESLENEVVPEIQPIVAIFAENYGTTPLDVNNAF